MSSSRTAGALHGAEYIRSIAALPLTSTETVIEATLPRAIDAETRTRADGKS